MNHNLMISPTNFKSGFEVHARKPNFFVVGAPHCGTTSLSEWLATHPEVCISKPKEPHFFNPEYFSTVNTLEEYEAFFAHAQPQHSAIGEASTHTMYSETALGGILKYQPQAKFIVCLRNPVEMAISAHNHMVFDGVQPIHDFIKAWNSETELWFRNQRRAYQSCKFYRYRCALGSHYNNLKKILPEDRLLTLILDDLILNRDRELNRVTHFLGIKMHSAPYPKSNPSKQPRSRHISHAVNKLLIFK